MNARIISLLCNDDVEQYKKEFPNNDAVLDRWVRSNMIHVAEHCPDVYHLWSNYGSNMDYPVNADYARSSEVRVQRAQDFFVYVAQSLQPLPETDRVAILKGRNTNELETFFYSNIKSTNCWENLSPVWSGTPGTELHSAAQQLGLTQKKWLSQITNALVSSDGSN